jgi:hypothetical protein
MEPLVSSLSAGDSLVQRLTVARYQRLHIYNYDEDLKMSRIMLKTCRGFE